MFEIFIYIITFLISYTGVGLFLRWGLRRKILDIPNERSLHTAPTPRGGGLVLVVICLLFYTFYSVYSAENVKWGYILGSILIAVISWIDDIYDVSFLWRMLVHFTAAFLIVFSGATSDQIYLPFLHTVNAGNFGTIIIFCWVVWMTNAYNFMDGIDGLAGMQAVTAGLGWLLAGKMLDFNILTVYGGILCFAALGFLIHNWQPAKVFMGDVGSAFLGYTFASMPLLTSERNNINYKYLPLITTLLVLPFVVDTVFTIIKRIMRGEKIWQAHRTHIYQRLVISGYSHQSVTIIYCTVSLLIILAIIYELSSPE